MPHTTNISIRSLTAETLNKAALIRAEIDKLEKQLTSLLGGHAAATARAVRKSGRTSKLGLANGADSASAKRKKRNLSPEARARIVAAVKARWAREKANSKNKS